MNLSEIRSGWGLLGAGRVMVNAVKGKQAQVAAGAITTFLGLFIAFGDRELHLHLTAYVHTAAQMFGMPDAQFMAGAGVFLYGLFNWILTVCTTDKIGVTGRATPDAAPVPSPAPKPAAIAVSDMGGAPDAAGVQRAPDVGANDDATLHAGG